MKNLLKKSWFTGILILGLVIITILLNFWTVYLELTWSYDYASIISIPIDQLDGGSNYIFAYVLKWCFYLLLIPIVLSLMSYIRKRNRGFIVAGLLLLSFSAAVIVFQTISGYLPLLGSILMIINIVLTMGIFTLIILRAKSLNENNQTTLEDKASKLNNTKIPLVVLFINIIAILVFLTTFIIPLYTEGEYNAVIINVLLSNDTHDIALIYFLANFVLFLITFLYFSNILSNYIFNKKKFMKQSKQLVTFVFIATAIFFLTGYAIKVFFGILYSSEIQTISYVPMLIMFLVVIVHSMLIGKYKDYDQEAMGNNISKYFNIEPLVYVVILTAITVLMLFLSIIKINLSSGGYSYVLNLTGFDILRDYLSLDPSYRLAAYLLFVMLVSVGFCLILAITSYLSKSKVFNSMVKLSTSVNLFFVFIIAMSGYYFQIARDINQAIVADIATFYGINITNMATLEYQVSTDTIYALIASVFVLVIMFIRRVFDREDIVVAENGGLLGSSSSTVPTEVEEETISNFDPCYSFTELDSKTKEFNDELQNRKALKSKNATLNGLVNFVVEYARNSRLHLSYTPEDIATFVAGLGASKLSILQGMSGTGKTSLPKIFSEAIYGNCDIIEVESSWKDKNELLGYYNEFSLHYTPKKFTLALYKAALNQEVFTFILLDEMNLSRIEYYFSDFLSLMENEEEQREIKLINIKLDRKEDGNEIDYLALENGHTLKVPANVWFIGTANRDESTFVISDKVYDRAHTMNFTKRAPKVRNYQDPISKQYYDYETMRKLFDDAKAKGSFDAEKSELISSIEKLLAPYNISFGNRILKQIEDFVNIYNECFVNDDVESEAIEKILLSKVVAKLEVKTIEDKDQLIMEFEKLNLYQCAEFIKHLDED